MSKTSGVQDANRCVCENELAARKKRDSSVSILRNLADLRRVEILPSTSLGHAVYRLRICVSQAAVWCHHTLLNGVVLLCVYKT